MAGLRTLKILFFISLLFSVSQCLYFAWTSSWTFDEPNHLEWSRRVIDLKTTSREAVGDHSQTPIIVPNILFSRQMQQHFGISANWDIQLMRSFNCIWLIGMIVLTYFVASRIADQRAGLLAGIGVALDPNLITHSALLTVDAAYAFACLAFLSSCLFYVRRPCWLLSVAIGVSLGLAFSTKFSALLLGVSILLLPLALDSMPKISISACFRCFGHFVLAGLIAILVIDCFYNFIAVGFFLSELPLRFKPLIELVAKLPRIWLPLPADLINGIDHCLEEERGKSWNVILLNKQFPQGIWYYFIVLWFVKTPVSLLLAHVSGVLQLFSTWLFKKNAALRFIFANFLFFLFYFSFLFHTQVGYRYALMCLPLLNIAAAIGLSSLNWSGVKNWILFPTILLPALEISYYTGNPLSFSNFLIQPKSKLYKVMADSNIDWAQNGNKFNELMQKAQIDLGQTHFNPVHILSGHNTFELNHLSGVFNFDQHRWVREHLQPGGQVGHTYIWFEVTPQQFEDFLNSERVLVRQPVSGTECGSLSATRQAVRIGQPLRIYATSNYQQFCISANRNSTIRIVSNSKSTQFGIRDSSGNCKMDWLDPGKEVWYKLEPGAHQFCISSEKEHELQLHLKNGWIDFFGN